MVSRLDQHILGALRVDGNVTLPGPDQVLNVGGDIFASERISAPGMVVGKSFDIDFSALDVAATTTTVSVNVGVASPTVWTPVFAYSHVVSTFAAPGLSALTWLAGWTGGGALGVDPDALLLQGDSDGLTLGRYQQASAHRGVALDGSALYSPDGDNQLSVSVTATGANLDTLTKGNLRIYLWFLREPVE